MDVSRVSAASQGFIHRQVTDSHGCSDHFIHNGGILSMPAFNGINRAVINEQKDKGNSHVSFS